VGCLYDKYIFLIALANNRDCLHRQILSSCASNDCVIGLDYRKERTMDQENEDSSSDMAAKLFARLFLDQVLDERRRKTKKKDN